MTNKSVQTSIVRRFENTMDAMKLKYFGHIMRKNNRVEKQTLIEPVKGMRRCGRLRITLLGCVRELIVMTMEQLDIVHETIIACTVSLKGDGSFYLFVHNLYELAGSPLRGKSSLCMISGLDPRTNFSMLGIQTWRENSVGCFYEKE